MTLRYLLPLLLLAACSSSSGEPAPPASAPDPPADPPAPPAQPPPAPHYPAIHPQLPSAQTLGGRVLHAPRIVTITFEGDPFEADVRKFDDAITTTPYWTAATSEYCDKTACIGAGSGGAYATLPVPATTLLADDDLRALIRARVADATLPAPAEGTVYTVYIPAGVTVTMPVKYGASRSCVSYHAYHEHLDIDGVDAAYAIITRCPDASTLDAATMMASHELVEAATDPDIDGWYVPDEAWSSWHGGEVTDVCLGVSTTKEGAWTVERTFSGKAARAGKQPCVPADADDDFGVAPANAASVVPLALGDSKKIPLVGWTLAPGADFSISAFDPSNAGELNAALDRTTANDGTALTLRVAWNKTPAAGSATILLRTKRGTRVEAWPVLVTLD
jgi:hypothetical protein